MHTRWTQPFRTACDLIMDRRAQTLAMRLAHVVPHGRPALDIGSGTGHNARALMRVTSNAVIQADIADLSIVGRPPIRFDRHLPFRHGTIGVAMLIYVLQYPARPCELLREAAYVADGSVLVLQSTYTGWLGAFALAINELVWGPIAFLAARLAGLVAPRRFTLATRRLYTRPGLIAEFQRAGLRVRERCSWSWLLLPVSDDLYILEFDHAANPREDVLNHYRGA